MPKDYIIRVPIKEHGGFYINGVVRGGHSLYVFEGKDGLPMIRCGCYCKSIKDFEQRIEEIKTDTTYVDQLRLIVKLIRLRFKSPN